MRTVKIMGKVSAHYQGNFTTLLTIRYVYAAVPALVAGLCNLCKCENMKPLRQSTGNENSIQSELHLPALP